MSGHNKWSTIKRKKGKLDAERGRLFTRFIREISIAARQGGGDLAGNPRLRTAVNNARAANMPSANIEKAIQKGTGELPGMTIEEFSYEGYGPGGVAVMVHAAGDNKNRATSEIRHIFAKHGGNMGELGCVSWLFHRKGLITVSASSTDEDTLMEVAIEAGAEDVRRVDNDFEITTDPADFEKVKEAIAAKGIKTESAEVTMIPQTTVKLEGKQAQQMIRLMEALEENDDVQNVYANFDIADEEFEKADK